MSTPSSITLNRVPTDPQLKDLLDLWRKDLLLNLNCHAVATVQSFDSTKQTAKATINYKKTFFQLIDGVYQPVLVDYPILADCPVIIMGGGPAGLTFPIAKGDTCVVLFNDRDLDNWSVTGSADSPVNTGRLHSFSDAILLVGLRPQTNAVSNYDTARTVLFNGTTMVGVGASKVKIANNMSTLNGLLQDLINELKSFVSTVSGGPIGIISSPAPGSPVPTNPAVIASLVTLTANITATATQIGGLLE